MPGAEDFRAAWDGLDADTRDWLTTHNGEPLAEWITVPPSWVGADGALRDEIVDWVEAVANGEQPG